MAPLKIFPSSYQNHLYFPLVKLWNLVKQLLHLLHLFRRPWLKDSKSSLRELTSENEKMWILRNKMRIWKRKKKKFSFIFRLAKLGMRDLYKNFRNFKFLFILCSIYYCWNDVKNCNLRIYYIYIGYHGPKQLLRAIWIQIANVSFV